MGLFSQTRAVMKLQKRWRKMWDGPDRAADPRPGMDPDRALHNLANLANTGGGTTGDSLMIAMNVVEGVDEYQSYPAAMEDLQHFYEAGELLTTSGHQIRQLASWPAVVELAEAACLLARPVKVQGWVNEQCFAAGREEENELDQCVALAPLTSIDTYGHWKSVLAEAKTDDEDYKTKVQWLEKLMEEFKAAGISGIPRLS